MAGYDGEYFPSVLQKQYDLEQDREPFGVWRQQGRASGPSEFDDKPVFLWPAGGGKILVPYRAEYEPNPAGQPAIDRVVKQGVILRVLYRTAPGPGAGAGTGSVVLWTQAGYAGESIKLSDGRHALGPLATKIQSIQLPAGAQITLFENPDLSGPSLTLKTSSPDLSGWRNIAQSVQISGAGGGGTGANTGGGTVPPPAPTYGGGQPQTSPPGTTPPPPPAAPLDPNRQRGTVVAPVGAPPPQAQTRDPQVPPGYGPPGLPPLNPAQGYELYCTVFGLGVPLSVAQAVAAFAPLTVAYYLLGTRTGDERRGFRLSGPQGAVMRAAAQALPGQGPQALGMPAFVGAITLTLQGRTIVLLSAQDFEAIRGLVRA